MFNSVVQNNDPEPVVRNMVKMLSESSPNLWFSSPELLTDQKFKIIEPGGYVTWGEFDFASWKTISSTGGEPSSDLDKLLHYNATVGNTKPVNFLATQ